MVLIIEAADDEGEEDDGDDTYACILQNNADAKMMRMKRMTTSTTKLGVGAVG